MRTDSAAVAGVAQRRPAGNLSRRASLNALAAGLDFVARSVVELVVNPLLVAGLGAHVYGTWRVLWQWTGYVWATSGRSSQALQFVIANRQHVAEEHEKRGYVASALIVWLLFLPVLLGVGALGVWLAPLVLHTPPDLVGPVRWAAALLVADAIALTVLSASRSVLQGENLGYKRMGLSTVLVLVGGVLTALAVLLGTGIVGVAAASLANTVLTGVLFWRIAHVCVPWFGLARPSRATVRWFLGLSSWFLGWKLVAQLMTASDVLLLGALASVGLVTVYVLTKFVAESLNRLLVVVVNGVTPGLAGLVGAGHHGKAVRVRNETMALTWLVVTVVGASILLWNASFVGVWVGGEHYAGTLATLLIVVMVGQFCFIRNDGSLIDATLNLRVKVLTGGASTAVSIGLAALLVGRYDFGIPGLCVGIVAGRMILTVVYPWQVGRSLGYPLTTQLRGITRPAVTTAALFAAALALQPRLAADSWAALVAGAVATAAVLTVLAAWGGLTADQRQRLTRRLRVVLRGGSGGRRG
jgi:O-antigen/teichoic acid export membrane protein